MLLVNHPQRHVPANFEEGLRLGTIAWLLRVEFVEQGEHTGVFLRCWDSSQFRRVCLAELDRFSGNVSEEVVVLGHIIDAIGPDVRVVSVQGGPHALVEAYVHLLGSG